ncbi:MAG: 23S rRNA (adenine(2503)-C(2))-methyltransferase RlmN [Desulfobacterales bacterium]|jgi:23S rRNA (adenine2503-C2)-methyltransferase
MTEISPKTNILDMSRQQLARRLSERGEAGYRADQIRQWLFQKHADTFDEMTNLSKGLRSLLRAGFTIDIPVTVDLDESRDGSRKFLFRLKDGILIESVLIPEKDHDTLCISSQAGCAQRCRFCLTGTGGLERNLTSGEILGQVLAARVSMARPDRLTNIVFMGMGEPLANVDAVLSALDAMTDSVSGLGFSSRRITVSTVGMVSRMEAFGQRSRVNLAISLNATDDQTRSKLMPINRRHPISELIDACRRYPLPPRRRITFEYILLEGINDQPANARQLASLLKPVRAKINLIPFNEHPGCEYRRPPDSVVEAFQRILVDRHYTAVVRHSKGLDIKAACGQLKAKTIGKTP